MTVDEIKQAKREAEASIQQIVHDLQEKTGLVLASVDVSARSTEWLPGGGKRVWVEVSIDLRVPP